MNASPAAAKAFIDNLGFTGITTAVSSSGTNISQIKHNNILVIGGLKVYYNNGGSSFEIGSSSSEIHYTSFVTANISAENLVQKTILLTKMTIFSLN